MALEGALSGIQGAHNLSPLPPPRACTPQWGQKPGSSSQATTRGRVPRMSGSQWTAQGGRTFQILSREGGNSVGGRGCPPQPARFRLLPSNGLLFSRGKSPTALLTQEPHPGGTGTSPTHTLDPARPACSWLPVHTLPTWARPQHLLALPLRPAQPSHP